MTLFRRSLKGSVRAVSNVLGTLSICRRAGKLILGTDEAKNSCRRGESKGILLARDLSPKSRKEMQWVCEQNRVPIIELDCDMDEIGISVGKRCGVMSVTDKGFFESILKKLKINREGICL